MEQKKEIDLTGFLLRAISMTDKALDDAKIAIIETEDMKTYAEAVNKMAYATGLIDLNQELIGYMLDSGFEKIMSGIVQNWDSRLAFLEELLEEQKPSSSKSAEPNGKAEGSDSYKFISDVRVFKKPDVDVKPGIKIAVYSNSSADGESVEEIAEKISKMFSEKLQKKGETHEPR